MGGSGDLTEDRDPTEHRAMLRVALRLDLERGSFTSTNDELTEPHLVQRVLDTAEDPKAPHLAAADDRRYRNLLARWARCSTCGFPMGVHVEDDRCPKLTPYFLAHYGRTQRRPT